jgi:hypothetical protein
MYPQERTYIVWYEYTVRWYDLSGNEQTLVIRNSHRPENDYTMRIFGPMDPNPNPLEQPVTFTLVHTLYDGANWSDYDIREEGRVRDLCAAHDIPYDRLLHVTMSPVAKWITEITTRSGY